ncbi:MAG: hypothetical protein KGL78_13945 [Burkholderiales bacterium]|nr:hypothetical protein [Burkholderiales bacterium]
MLFFRLVFGALLVGSALCFAMYIGTREAVWRRRGVVILTWTLVAAFAFFAVLIGERVLRIV